MASKPRRRPDRTSTAAGDPLRAEAERLIAKGKYKDAVKQAKIAHKQGASPENHRLLERAYLLRAQQLERGGMPTAAQEVMQHLIDFGLSDPDLVEPSAALMLTLGMTGKALELQGKVEAPEAKERLARQAADQ